MIDKPDLSFTQDPNWLQTRETLWTPLEATLKEAYRKKDIAARKVYFFTGEITTEFKDAGKGASNSSLIEWFPLTNSAGWDYVLSELTPHSRIYEYVFYRSISGPAYGISDIDSKLRFFDYFHESILPPVIRSKFPVGKEKKIVEFAPDTIKICENMASQFLGFVTKDRKTHCFHRRHYFFDLLRRMADQSALNSYTLGYSLPLFKNLESNFEPEVIPENLDQQKQFLREFAECVNELPDDSVVRALLDKSRQ